MRIALPLAAGLTAALLSTLLLGCYTVSETGRSQMLLYPDTTMASMAVDAYATEIDKHKVIENTPAAKMVEDVGQRIRKACGKEEGYAWEFKLLDAPKVVNAFCLPGGKIAVYSGLLKVAPDADSLAAVMGHEIAHATAQHGNERLTQATAAKGVMLIGAFVLDDEGDPKKKKNNQLIQQALGLTTELGLKKYSRVHESEADEIGLRYLMLAGFDPHAAPKLWERMAKLNGGKEQGLLEGFLSTHPDPKERAQRLRELIPKLQKELAKKGE